MTARIHLPPPLPQKPIRRASPDIEWAINVPLIIVALALVSGTLTVMAICCRVAWRLLHG